MRGFFILRKTEKYFPKHLFVWVWRFTFVGMKQVVKDIFAALVYVCTPTKRDPKRFAQTPPKGWHGAAEAEPPNDKAFFEVKNGGIPNVFDEKGLRWEGAKTVAEQKAEIELSKEDEIEITPKEYGEMVAYQVSKQQTGLFNIPFAKQVKHGMRQGKTDSEIAALTGKSTSLVRQYRNCLDRANGNAKAV